MCSCVGHRGERKAAAKLAAVEELDDLIECFDIVFGHLNCLGEAFLERRVEASPEEGNRVQDTLVNVKSLLFWAHTHSDKVGPVIWLSFREYCHPVSLPFLLRWLI